MFARMTVVQGSPDKIEAGVDAFKSQVLPIVKAIDGYRAGFLLVDRSSGKGMGITLWESEEARRNAAEAVEEARRATIETMGGSVPPVEEYDVAAWDL